MTTAFISHSSADKDWFRRLAYAFERAGVAVWDYLAEDRTTIGGPLHVEVRQVLACDLFVVIVSSRSLQNCFVAGEVATALARGLPARARLFVVVLPDAPVWSVWPAPFGDLRDIVWHSPPEPQRMEDVAAEILGIVEETYVAAAADPPRLPLSRRTLDELAATEPEVRARVATRPQAQLNLLVRTLEDAASAYARDEVDLAAANLERGRLQLATYAPGFEPYYLVLAHAVCALHLENYPMVTTLLASLAGHASRDESWHGAQGALALAQGRVADARDAYKLAVEVARQRQTGDFEAAMNLHAVEILLGTMISELPVGFVGDDEERITVACIIAAGRLHHGDANGAVAALRDISLADHDERSLSLFASALEATGQVTRARRLIEAYLDEYAPTAPPGAAPSHALLWRCLARGLVTDRRHHEAIAIYRGVLCVLGAALHPDAALHLVEYARLLRVAGLEDEMRAVCARVLTIDPRDGLGYYCFGFAAYLLDQGAVAQAMHSLSKGYGRWYQAVLDADPVAA